MKMAKATPDDIQRVIDFFRFIEEFMDYGAYTPESEEVEEDSVDLTDEQFVEHLRKLWGRRFGPVKVDAAWSRVVFGFQVLLDNVCDPEADTLEWKPEIAKKLADPEGLEEVLNSLNGPKDSFRAALTDRDEILARICDNVAAIAQRRRREPWSVMGQITGHGSGVSAAIYALYSRKPVTVSEAAS